MTRGSTSIGCNEQPSLKKLAPGCRFMPLRAFTIPVRFKVALLIGLSTPIEFLNSVACFLFPCKLLSEQFPY